MAGCNVGAANGYVKCHLKCTQSLTGGILIFFHAECRGAPPFAFAIANRLWVLFVSIPTAASPLCSSRPGQVGKSSALPPDYCSCVVRQSGSTQGSLLPQASNWGG